VFSDKQGYKVNQNKIIQCVQQWLNQVVIEHNLCPFANREAINNRIRYFVSRADIEDQLLLDLSDEFEVLNRDQSIETVLLIIPNMLQSFPEYNQFLNYVDELIKQLDLLGIYQIASFHPDYQFANTTPDDVENYTNRSPYPILHILREESLKKAIANYLDVEKIPNQNIERLLSLGETELNKLISNCSPVNKDGK